MEKLFLLPNFRSMEKKSNQGRRIDLSFTPSTNPQINKVKHLCKKLLMIVLEAETDTVFIKDMSDAADNGEEVPITKIMIEEAREIQVQYTISSIIDAQMNLVKLLTWK